MESSVMRRSWVLGPVLALVAAVAGVTVAPVCSYAADDLPEGVVARVYERDITESDLLLRLAKRYENSKWGQEVLETLVEDICVAREAAERGITVSEAAARTEMEAAEERIRRESGGNASLRDLPGFKSASDDELLQIMMAYMVREQMARADLGTEPGAELPEHRLKLWLTAIRRRAKVRYKELPEDILARVGETDIERPLFARALRERLPKEFVAEVRARMVIEVATQRALDEAGVSISDADVEAELQRIRDRFAQNPEVRGSGVTFDQFLQQSRGFGEAELRSDPAFKAGLALRRLYDAEITPVAVRAHWEKNREAYGERALVREVRVLATRKDAEFEIRTFEEAYTLALRAKVQILEAAGRLGSQPGEKEVPIGKVVGEVAKRFETDEDRKKAAGQPRAWTRAAVVGEEKLEEAVFGGPLNVLQGPVRSRIGYHVFVVEGRRAAPTYEEVQEKVREDLLRQRMRRFQLELRADEKILFGD